jgi:hypothetical protein
MLWTIPPSLRRNVRTKLTKRTKSPRCGGVYGDKRNDISVYGLRAFRLSPSVSSWLDSPRPVFRSCCFSKLSKLLNQEDALGAPCLQRFVIAMATTSSRGVTFASVCTDWKPCFRGGLAGFSSRCRLSPLFYEDAQIIIFPAPISCLGDRHVWAAGDAFG